MRLNWIKSIESNDINTLRFITAILGLGESSFRLNERIQEHLTTSKQRYPEYEAHLRNLVR